MPHANTLLDLAGSAITMAAVAVDLVAVAQALSASFLRRLALAAVAGGWVGLAMGLGASGRLAFSPNAPVPLIGVLFAVPLLAAGALALASRRLRAALLAIPLHLLVALNALRMLGFLFLLDALAGTLSGPFPLSAGIGDIVTGALAIPLAVALAGPRQPSRRLIAAWNAFGTLDLLAAVALGITSAAGSPLQLIHAGVGSQAMQFLPLCLVPTVLVPFYLLTHAVVAARLRASSGSLSGNPSARPTRNPAAI